MNKRTLQYIGAAIYACEGTKARRDFRTKSGLIRSIEFTNSDPKIIFTFGRFLREIICADWSRVKGQVFLYPDLKESELIPFWSKVSGIPVLRFQKSILLKGTKNKKSQYGTFKIRYSNKDDFEKLDNLISELWRDAGAV